MYVCINMYVCISIINIFLVTSQPVHCTAGGNTAARARIKLKSSLLITLGRERREMAASRRVVDDVVHSGSDGE